MEREEGGEELADKPRPLKQSYVVTVLSSKGVGQILVKDKVRNNWDSYLPNGGVSGECSLLEVVHEIHTTLGCHYNVLTNSLHPLWLATCWDKKKCI